MYYLLFVFDFSILKGDTYDSLQSRRRLLADLSVNISIKLIHYINFFGLILKKFFFKTARVRTRPNAYDPFQTRDSISTRSIFDGKKIKLCTY